MHLDLRGGETPGNKILRRDKEMGYLNVRQVLPCMEMGEPQGWKVPEGDLLRLEQSS